MKYLDVSCYQPNIDYQKVAGQCDGVILRLGFTGWGADKPTLDSTFIKHYNGFKSAGVPVGVYYFTLASSEELALAEGKFIVETLKNYKLDLPVWIDAEDQTNSKKWTNLSKADRTHYLDVLMNYIEKAGYYVGIYANLYWFNNKLGDLSKYDKWVAQYNTKCTYTGEYGMWQYTSSDRIDGIDGNVDASLVYKYYPLIIANMGSSEHNSGTSALENHVCKAETALKKIREILEEYDG